MLTAELVAFGLTMAVGQLTPGPDMLLILKNTLNHGFTRGLRTIAGICTGVVVHVLVVYAGLAVLFTQTPILFRGVQWVGAAYLLWVAWKLVRSTDQPSGELSKHSAPLSRSHCFWEGLLTNLTNVKVMVLFSSLLAPLASDETGLPWIYGIIIITEAALIWPLFCWLMQGRTARHWFQRHQVRLNRVFGLMLAGFAVHLAISAIPQVAG